MHDQPGLGFVVINSDQNPPRKVAGSNIEYANLAAALPMLRANTNGSTALSFTYGGPTLYPSHAVGFLIGYAVSLDCAWPDHVDRAELRWRLRRPSPGARHPVLSPPPARRRRGPDQQFASSIRTTSSSGAPRPTAPRRPIPPPPPPAKAAGSDRQLDHQRCRPDCDCGEEQGQRGGFRQQARLRLQRHASQLFDVHALAPGETAPRWSTARTAACRRRRGGRRLHW